MSRVKKIIHVNQAIIKKNRKTGSNDPPIIVRTYKGSQNAHEISIKGTITFKHSPHKPLSCGARLWAETYDEVEILS